MLPAIGFAAAAIASLYVVPISTQSNKLNDIVLVTKKSETKSSGVLKPILSAEETPTKKKSPTTKKLCTPPGGKTPKTCE